MLAAKLVLSYPVWKGELSVGTETTNTHSTGISQNEEGWVPASDTRIKESNTAGFAEYKLQLGHRSRQCREEPTVISLECKDNKIVRFSHLRI